MNKVDNSLTLKDLRENNNRALSIAKSFIPNESEKLYYREICNGCKYDKEVECQECCYCQDGIFYVKDTVIKKQYIENCAMCSDCNECYRKVVCSKGK